MAGAGLCLALVVGAGAGPALADPGGSGTASGGDPLRLAGLPDGGSFDPLRLDQIAQYPDYKFTDRTTADHTIPFTLTNPSTGTAGSFKVRVMQQFFYNGKEARLDQPLQVSITKDPGWPWRGVKIRAGEAPAQNFQGLSRQIVSPYFSIDNKTPWTLRLGSRGGSETIPAGSTIRWTLETTVDSGGGSSTDNGFGELWKTNFDDMLPEVPQGVP